MSGRGVNFSVFQEEENMGDIYCIVFLLIFRSLVAESSSSALFFRAQDFPSLHTTDMLTNKLGIIV
jgi:hypothetical protein